MAYLKEDTPESNYDGNRREDDFVTRKAEITKNLTWCSRCGRLGTTIPVGSYKCPYCGEWTKFHLTIRAFKLVMYRQRKVHTLLRKSQK